MKQHKKDSKTLPKVQQEVARATQAWAMGDFRRARLLKMSLSAEQAQVFVVDPLAWVLGAAATLLVGIAWLVSL